MRLQHALIAACLFGAGAAAVAEPVVFSSPRPGELVRAGARIEVRWSGVPSDAQEMELLLSLDGGRRIAVRLTSEMPAGARSFSWKIPNLASSRASLVLRTGSSGRETVVGASAPFTILADASLGFETVTERAGELWLASQTDPDEPLGPAGVAPQQDGWSASGPCGIPASVSSSYVVTSLSRAAVSSISTTPSHRRAARPEPDRIPAPSPTLRI